MTRHRLQGVPAISSHTPHPEGTERAALVYSSRRTRVMQVGVKFHFKGMVVIEAIHRTTKALPLSKLNIQTTFKRCQNV